VTETIRSVAVAGGGLVRDTVEMTFPLQCAQHAPRLHISVPTSGEVPQDNFYYDYDQHFHILLIDPSHSPVPSEIGMLLADGGIEIDVSPGTYRLQVRVTEGCTVDVANPTDLFTIELGDFLNFEFPVTCPAGIS
jgi:hypothetical protein